MRARLQTQDKGAGSGCLPGQKMAGDECPLALEADDGYRVNVDESRLCNVFFSCEPDRQSIP